MAEEAGVEPTEDAARPPTGLKPARVTGPDTLPTRRIAAFSGSVNDPRTGGFPFSPHRFSKLAVFRCWWLPRAPLCLWPYTAPNPDRRRHTLGNRLTGRGADPFIDPAVLGGLSTFIDGRPPHRRRRSLLNHRE